MQLKDIFTPATSNDTDKTLFIAEAGVNMSIDESGKPQLEQGYKLIDAAAEAGADYVKFQTFKSELLVSLASQQAAYQAANLGKEKVDSQYEMLKKLEISHEMHFQLKAHCDRAGIGFLSTPFEPYSCDFLVDELGVDAMKVSSGGSQDLRLLKRVASKNIPFIMSTGMGRMEDAVQAVEFLREHGANNFSIMHCVTSYPADPAISNLRAMVTMAETFGVPGGWSDHTLHKETALLAVALGARTYETHFTTDKTLTGPDHKASLEPDQLKDWVNSIREVEKDRAGYLDEAKASLGEELVTQILGDGIKQPNQVEINIAKMALMRLHTTEDLPAGAILTQDNTKLLRGSGEGIRSLDEPLVMGRVTAQPLQAEQQISWADVVLNGKVAASETNSDTLAA